MRHSNLDDLYVPTRLKKNRTRMLKSLSILKNMHPDDTVAVSNIDAVKLNPNIIVLKIDFGEMRKRSRPHVILFQKLSKLKSPEEHYLRLLQLYMPWRNENRLKQENHSYEDRHKEVEGDILCDIKKHESYLDIDHEELQNVNFVQSDDEEDNAEFSVINPNLPDLYLEESDIVNNTIVVSTIIDNFLLPNEQFYEICSQLNEDQQHLFNFIMQYSLHCKLGEKNNELPPNHFKFLQAELLALEKAF